MIAGMLCIIVQFYPDSGIIPLSAQVRLAWVVASQ
jgi:hypothetical protein